MSHSLARKCRRLLRTGPGNVAADTLQEIDDTASRHHVDSSQPSATAQGTSSSANVGTISSSFASTQPGDQSVIGTSLTRPINESSISTMAETRKNQYVLFCLYQKSQIQHAQIEAAKCRTDEDFFEDMRRAFRRLRGFWRFWFSPFQFDHCEFVKFTRFYVNELARVGRSLPLDFIYQYSPSPPGPHEDPPISPHEFRRRFYTNLINPCRRQEALERIPKRQKRFQVNLHVDGREDMWGLHVELRPCFLIIILWQMLITAAGWGFMGWWLSRHGGDIQSAAVPVTLIITAVMALWVPIHDSMKVT